MKRDKGFMVLALMLCTCTFAWAKDIRTVVLKTTPEMHCANCEKKIKSNIRFEKGIKDIVTNLQDKTVTIKYDADKTTVKEIVTAFGKIGYKATVAIPLSAVQTSSRASSLKDAPADAMKVERGVQRAGSTQMVKENGKAVKAARSEIK